ncbi:hypothetical protein LINGRAHAP2_LOCUS9313, partial [Linum grandiflorum]
MYELLTGTELAGLILGDFASHRDDRDIIVNHRMSGLTRIINLNPLFDSLHFPLLFPHGGVSYMQQLYRDAMTVCQYYKNSDLLITFTCNAQWPEIINAFKSDMGTHGKDKPTVIARVFRMRLSH